MTMQQHHLQPAPTPRLGTLRQWHVTALHRQTVLTEDGPVHAPYGQGHVRRLGTARTACGLPALNWPILWGLPVDRVSDMCHECRCVAIREVVGTDGRPPCC